MNSILSVEFEFVQSFFKNVLEEEKQNCLENMLQCLADHIDDAIDRSWATTKASAWFSHARQRKGHNS